MDLGGSYVGPQQLYMQRLIKELGIDTYKVNGKGHSVYLNKVSPLRSQLSRLLIISIDIQKQRYLHACDSLPRLGSMAEIEIKHVLRQIDRMCNEIPLDEPWKATRAAQWDQITFAQYLDQKCWTQEAKDFISLYMSCCTSCEAHEGSLLWTLWFTKQCEGLEIMYNMAGAAQDSKLCGGTQQISEKLRELIDRDQQRVLLNKAVSQIIYEVDKVDENNNANSNGQDTSMVVVKTLDGSTYRCRYLINTIPISLQQKIHFTPSLPPLYNQMMQKFPMGSVIKCIVYYREAFWRRDGLNGNLMINLDNESGPITYTLDDTKPDGTYPAVVGFIIGNRAKEMLAKTKEERLRFICDSYAKALGSHLAKEVSSSEFVFVYVHRSNVIISFVHSPFITRRRIGCRSNTRAGVSPPSARRASSPPTVIYCANHCSGASSRRAPRPRSTGRATWRVRCRLASRPLSECWHNSTSAR